jgi:hypothetical protein
MLRLLSDVEKKIVCPNLGKKIRPDGLKTSRAD